MMATPRPTKVRPPAVRTAVRTASVVAGSTGVPVPQHERDAHRGADGREAGARAGSLDGAGVLADRMGHVGNHVLGATVASSRAAPATHTVAAPATNTTFRSVSPAMTQGPT